MSTRSGKRIHSSFQETIVNTEAEITRTQRKTRSKHIKENVDVINASPNVKPRHYVRYPTSDDDPGTAVEDGKDGKKKTRILRTNALKEHNMTSSIESAEPDTRKSVRSTRKTRRFAEDTENLETHTQDVPKPKKSKNVVKKMAVPKKKSKKKKGHSSGPIVVENILPGVPSILNGSNMSVDSFHSAAGSPRSSVCDDALNISGPVLLIDTCQKTTPKVRKNRSAGNLDSTLTTDATDKGSNSKSRGKSNSGTEKDKNIPEKMSRNLRIRKSSIKDTEKCKNSTFEAEINFSSSTRKSVQNTTVDKSVTPSKVDTTYEIDEKISSGKKIKSDTTFDKDSTVHNNTENCTFDVASSADEVSSSIKMNENGLNRKSLINITYDKETNQEPKVNTTFDKEDIKPNNTTFDKDTSETEIKNKRKSLPPVLIQKIPDPDVSINLEQGKKLDTTFNKDSPSSIISSDNSVLTLDKSNTSQISITSDESLNNQNLLNITPVLIESSLDESKISDQKTPHKTDSIAPATPLKREGTFTKDSSLEDPKTPNKTPLKTDTIAPITPLKREGTFTKDEPKSSAITPTKRMSLPSPGFTPFHVNKSSTKEKSILMNVTKSIEKNRRSSLAEPAKATKVMFCSPANNPALVIQNERKVIKSNLKGSNKSFVFDRSISLDTRPVNRKRSYTHSDADDTRVKRKCLANGAQQSVDRLSRPRTFSASGQSKDEITMEIAFPEGTGSPTPTTKAPILTKLAEPNTPKKAITPRKSDAKPARTKLPNFAALHQKQFDKMESLGECQSRRARRAKQLLTPTGGTDVLQRISPRDKSEQENSKESAEPSIDAKKPETPIKSLPAFKSLNPGYTRFGFKLNLDVNPFSITSKTQTRPKENKPNGPVTLKGIKNKTSLPSLSGATSRKEVAKQTIMREKSFTDRRNVKRTETRTENRTVIKGVRTNRRFELQMRMRDL